MRSPKGFMKNRKNIRLKEYDYSSKGLYFITICVREMKHMFGIISNNSMTLNKYGELIDGTISNYKNNKYEVLFYQIMPNHIHLILKLKNNEIIQLSSVVSKLKSECTFKIGLKNVWQKGYYERVIRDQKEYDNIVRYISENPFRDKYQW